jgi:hypothetical protein
MAQASLIIHVIHGQLLARLFQCQYLVHNDETHSLRSCARIVGGAGFMLQEIGLTRNELGFSSR